MIRFLAYLPAAIWAAGLLVLGGQGSIRSIDIGLPLDKAAHFALYGILGALTGWGWLRAGRRPGPVWPMLAVLALAAVDELHQGTLPARSAEVADWIADGIGAGLMFGIVARWSKRGREGNGNES